MIKLDLRTDLAKVTPETLGPRNACRYSGPCAVGAMLTEQQRYALVHEHRDTWNVWRLHDAGLLDAPDDQLDDLAKLQSAFDCDTHARQFDQTLAQLKEKYLAMPS